MQFNLPFYRNRPVRKSLPPHSPGSAALSSNVKVYPVLRTHLLLHRSAERGCHRCPHVEIVISYINLLPLTANYFRPGLQSSHLIFEDGSLHRVISDYPLAPPLVYLFPLPFPPPVSTCIAARSLAFSQVETGNPFNLHHGRMRRSPSIPMREKRGCGGGVNASHSSLHTTNLQ